MDKADLETYQVQLDQVELALQADPDNAELASLRSELTELISLTQQALSASAASASASKAKATASASAATSSAHKWESGDDCLAKYSGDGQWYPARIVAIGGSAENRQFSIVFKGYNNTELVNGSLIKPMPGSGAGHAGAGSGPGAAAGKRKLTKVEEEEKEKKKKKNEKKVEVRAAKAKEQTEKQQTWQKFAKKSERKGIHIAGVAGTSIFKSPDNPHGKVGVTGSGQGMTSVTQRGKHKFAADEDDA